MNNSPKIRKPLMFQDLGSDDPKEESERSQASRVASQESYPDRTFNFPDLCAKGSGKINLQNDIRTIFPIFHIRPADAPPSSMRPFPVR